MKDLQKYFDEDQVQLEETKKPDIEVLSNLEEEPQNLPEQIKQSQQDINSNNGFQCMSESVNFKSFDPNTKDTIYFEVGCMAVPQLNDAA